MTVPVLKPKGPNPWMLLCGSKKPSFVDLDFHLARPISDKVEAVPVARDQ
jgi:hypothetical protein